MKNEFVHVQCVKKELVDVNFKFKNKLKSKSNKYLTVLENISVYSRKTTGRYNLLNQKLSVLFILIL